MPPRCLPDVSQMLPRCLPDHDNKQNLVWGLELVSYIYTRIFGPPFGRPRFFRLTFRPRFAKSRNCLRIQTLKKHLGQKSTSFCREFRCASSWHSHLIRLPTFWKKSSGDSNWQNMTKLTIYMLKKSGGVIFLRSPKRRRQRPPDAQGWGSQSGVKTVSKEDFE